MECHICYEYLPNELIKTLDCNHQLCYFCYNNLTTHICPFCRSVIQRYEKHSDISINQVTQQLIQLQLDDVMQKIVKFLEINCSRKHANRRHRTLRLKVPKLNTTISIEFGRRKKQKRGRRTKSYRSDDFRVYR